MHISVQQNNEVESSILEQRNMLQTSRNILSYNTTYIQITNKCVLYSPDPSLDLQNHKATSWAFLNPPMT